MPLHAGKPTQVQTENGTLLDPREQTVGRNPQAPALIATETDGDRISFGPNLGPQSAKTGEFGRQSEARDNGLSQTKTPGKPAISGVFRGNDSGLSKVEAAGVEPASRSSEANNQQWLTASVPASLAQTLARNPQIDPSLARIVDAWPRLPEAIHKAMLALAESGE
jgi:hypothetical protein